jgi:DNA-binding MarR family transcriptional regulator
VIAECLLITTDSTISLLDTLEKRGLIRRRRIPATGASSSST